MSLREMLSNYWFAFQHELFPRLESELGPMGERYEAGHDEGAAAWARIASLIETCKMNGVEPYAWMKSTLEKIAAGHPQSQIHDLLPWTRAFVQTD